MYCLRIAQPFHLYNTTDTEDKKVIIEAVLETHNLSLSSEIIITPPIGRDMAPFFIASRDNILRHDICLRLHTKKSTHLPNIFGILWRTHLLCSLLPSTEKVTELIHDFGNEPHLGYITPCHWEPIAGAVNVHNDVNTMNHLLARIDKSVQRDSSVDYAAGSMFWFRSAAIKPLLDILSYDMFDADSKDILGGSLPHALERVVFLFAEHAGFWGRKCIAPIPYPVPFEVVKQLIKNSKTLARYPNQNAASLECDQGQIIESFIKNYFNVSHPLADWIAFENWLRLFASKRFTDECSMSPFLPFLILDEIVGQKES